MEKIIDSLKALNTDINWNDLRHYGKIIYDVSYELKDKRV